MSASTAIIYGYGFGIDVTDEILVEFAKNHRDTVNNGIGRKLLAYIDDGNTNISEKFSTVPCGVNGKEGIYSLVSNVMRLETGINFQYEPGDSDCDCYDTILLAESMPWEMNDLERGLTEETLKSIMRPYMDELGYKDKEPDYVKMEYYG